MTRARQQQIILSETPWYHLVNRCVRRAYLAGVDHVSGQNYEHRREWIEQLMFKLASVFSVDIAAFAVMSNHYHLVIRVDEPQAQSWSDQEVLERWTQLFTGPDYLQTYLNQPSAFHASMQPKIYELAILSVMAYVDLNPVRAAMSDTLEASDHTSIQRRLQQILGTQPNWTEQGLDLDSLHLSSGAQSFLERVLALPNAQLMDFNPHTQHTDQDAKQINYALDDYIEFVDYLGHAVHPNKRGHIPDTVPKLMQQLNFTDKLIEQMQQGHLLHSFGPAIGNLVHLKDHQTQHHQAFHKGNQQARAVFA